MAYLAQPLTLTLALCSPPGVYLRWLTPLGEWPGWLFSGDVDAKTEVSEAADPATADQRATSAVRRAATATLTVRAGDLSEAQHQALSTLLDSPQVYRQYDGSRQPVLVVANSSASRTSADGRHELEFTLKLPARNALTH